MKNINPTTTKAWKTLKKIFKKIKKTHIKDLFKKEENRSQQFSINFKNKIFIDYSKNHITKKILHNLQKLAKECDLKNSIKKMFSGNLINKTENRAVLHTALRNKNNNNYVKDYKNLNQKIKKELTKIKDFSENIISGKWKGYTGKKITDIVNIGIGGSELGPHMVITALTPYKNHLNIHFLSNIDGSNFYEIIKLIKPEYTLFIISSKTFTTQETITNAINIKSWFLKKTKQLKSLDNHFIAITNNKIDAKKIGIKTKNIFKIWNWTGGRYSIWSSVGLPISLSIGYKNFEKLLNGANEMDEHFIKEPFQKNIPVILALISIWYSNFFKNETESILVYDHYMNLLVPYLQQCNMESNGKNIDRAGKCIKYQTSPIIWGSTETNGQHSFHQLLYQGTKLVLCDFIIPVISHNFIKNNHIKLIANFLAQTKALAFGKCKKEIKKELKETKYNSKQINQLTPHKIIYGNQPTNSILIKKINPHNLGLLIALYEHKIFTQGVILNIYSFDQWGVELGKNLSKTLIPELLNKKKINKYDNSTNNLINQYKLWTSTKKPIKF